MQDDRYQRLVRGMRRLDMAEVVVVAIRIFLIFALIAWVFLPVINKCSSGNEL